MAAGDFTASVRLDLQARVEQMFSGGPHTYELSHPTPILDAMTELQTARPNPIMVGDTCIGMRVVNLKSGRSTVAYDGDGASTSLDCDLDAGFEPESQTKTYEDNYLVRDNIDVDLRDCNNIFQANEKRAFALNVAFKNIRMTLNQKLAAFLDTNKQANQDTQIANVTTPSGASITVNSNTLQVNPDDAQSWATLTVLEDIASINRLPMNSMMIAGRFWFRNEFQNAPFFTQNDDAGAAFAKYRSMPIYFDLEDLDQTVGGENLFFVDPNAYILWNTVTTPLGIVRELKSDLFETSFVLPGVQVRQPDGSFGPYVINAVRQLLCNTGRNDKHQHVIKERWELKAQGGLFTAPAGASSQTGILRFAHA